MRGNDISSFRETGALTTTTRFCRSFYELLDTACGKTAYIIGASPSVDAHIQLALGNRKAHKESVVFGINYAAIQFADLCDFGMLHDARVARRISTFYRERRARVLPWIVPEYLRGRGSRYRAEGVFDARLYLYPLEPRWDRRYAPTANQVRASLRTKRVTRIFRHASTAHSAVHIAALMGATNIVLLGCDSVNRGDRWHPEWYTALSGSDRRYSGGIDGSAAQGFRLLERALASAGVVLQILPPPT